LTGNDDPKGFETFPTDSSAPEFGGRIQHPIPYGEIGAAYNFRKVDYSSLGLCDDNEQRFGFDGRWDIGAGLWFEAVAQRQASPFLPYKWTKLTTLGMDYTFGLGNGLHILGEYLLISMSEDLPGFKEKYNFSAFLIGYPVNFFDSLYLIGYYAWDSNDYAQYASWERTYDKLIVSISLFHYPAMGGGALVYQHNAAVSGSGGRLMVIFNH
jgi:hypothetical protein